MSAGDDDDVAQESTGAMYAGLAYVIWGVMPLYWRHVGQVPAIQLTAHRVVWCAVFVAIVTVARGRVFHIFDALRQPGTLKTLALTGLLISVNWTIYLYCVESGQLVEASLGYFINPLISFALGYIFFGERMSRLRLAGAALAVAAVVIKTVAVGHISWIAPSLAVSFAFYGYFRKRVAIAALDGLLVETALLFPLGLGLLMWWGMHGDGIFPSRDLSIDALLIFGGPLTAIPLALFAAGARRVRMTTLGFLQYISPSITLLLAVFDFGERFTKLDLVTFGCTWLALAVVAFESQMRSKSRVNMMRPDSVAQFEIVE